KELDLEIVSKSASAASARETLREAHVDLVLLDFDLGNEAAIDFLRSVRADGFEGRVLILTAGVTQQEAVQLIEAGVAGILHKHNPVAALCATIRQVAAGEVCLEKSYLKSLFRTIDQTRPSSD